MHETTASATQIRAEQMLFQPANPQLGVLDLLGADMQLFEQHLDLLRQQADAAVCPADNVDSRGGSRKRHHGTADAPPAAAAPDSAPPLTDRGPKSLADSGSRAMDSAWPLKRQATRAGDDVGAVGAAADEGAAPEAAHGGSGGGVTCSAGGEHFALQAASTSAAEQQVASAAAAAAGASMMHQPLGASWQQQPCTAMYGPSAAAPAAGMTAAASAAAAAVAAAKHKTLGQPVVAGLAAAAAADSERGGKLLQSLDVDVNAPPALHSAPPAASAGGGGAAAAAVAAAAAPAGVPHPPVAGAEAPCSSVQQGQAAPGSVQGHQAWSPHVLLLSCQLSAEAKEAAETALEAAVASADAAAVAQPAASVPAASTTGPDAATSAAVACELVQMFCPEVTAVLALTPEIAGALHNPVVQLDHPPLWRESWGLHNPSQLLSLSGLRAACAGIGRLAGGGALCRKLLAAADAAPTRPCRNADGTGLLPFFKAARGLLLQALGEDVVQPLVGGSKCGAGQRLRDAVLARVQLAQLVVTTYNLLRLQVGVAQRSVTRFLPAPRHHTQPEEEQEEQQADAQAGQQPGSVLHNEPLSPPVLAVAEATLFAAAALAEQEAAATAAAGLGPRCVSQPGPHEGKVLVADASLALGLVQLFCPAVSALKALATKGAAAVVLPNLAVEWDDPPRFSAAAHAKHTAALPAQLLTRSGLRVAVHDIRPTQVRTRLQELASAVATPPAGSTTPAARAVSGGAAGGTPAAARAAKAQAPSSSSSSSSMTGLLPWFLVAHELLLAELQSDVWKSAHDAVSYSERLTKIVRGRVQLVQVVLTAYNLLARGGITSSASTASQAALETCSAPAAWQQQAQQPWQSFVHFDWQLLKRPSPSPSAVGIAEAALQAAAAALDRKAAAVAVAGRSPATTASSAAGQFQGQGSAFVADAALANGFVQMFCPAVTAVAALQLGDSSTTAPLHNMAVQLDDPPAWEVGKPLLAAQLLTLSGLRAACQVLAGAVQTQLQELAVAAAPARDGLRVGTGLLPWLWNAHALLLVELNSHCYMSLRPGDASSPGQRFRQLVYSRVQLAELVRVAYGVLRRGRLTARQQEDAMAALQQQQQQPAVPPAGRPEEPAGEGSSGLAQPGLTGHAVAAADAAGVAAPSAGSIVRVPSKTDAEHLQQQPHPQRYAPYQPPSDATVSAADAALKVAVAAALAASHSRGERRVVSVSSTGHVQSRVVVADAAAALQMVELFFPNILSAPAFQAAPEALPNIAVERDEPPAYLVRWGDWHDALPQEQLCTASGLKVAVVGVPKWLRRQLVALADAAADDDSCWGLLPFFVAARQLLMKELAEALLCVEASGGDAAATIMGRVQLAHVVFSVYEVLLGGRGGARARARAAATTQS